MSTNLGRNALLLAATSAGSYLFGLLRDRLLANSLGATRELDIFNSAFLLPDVIMNLFAAAITTAFIPVLAKARDQHKVANEVLTVIIACVLTMDVVAYLLMPWIAHVIAPGFNTAELTQLISSSRTLLLSPLLFGISILLGAVLQGRHHFVAYAVSPMLYNIGICLGIVFLTPIQGVLIGAALHLGIRLLATLRLRYIPKLSLQAVHSAEVRHTLRLIGPRVIGLIAIQATLWTYNAVGSTLEPGSVAVFNFARNFQSLPVSFIGIALATVIFPKLAYDYAQAQSQQFITTARQSLRMIIFLTVPAMIGMMFVSQPLITVFLGGGAFDQNAIQQTSMALMVFALVIPLECVQHILARVFYAQHNTTTPAFITLIGAGLNVIVCLIGAWLLGVVGLVIGFIVTTAFIDVGLWWWLQRHQQSLLDQSIRLTLGKTLMASAMMIVGVMLVRLLPLSDVAQLLILTGTGILTYAGMAALLRLPELNQVVALVRKR